MPTTQISTTGVRSIAAYAIGTLFFLYAFVQRVSPSVMTSELMAEFAVGGAALGILSGTYFYSYAIMQLPVGLLVDRFGPRNLMCVAALLSMMASYGFSVSDTLATASVFRALIGAAVAFPFVCTLSIISRLFAPNRFAMLTGLLLATGMLGAMAGQAPLRVFVEQFGWREVFQGLAVIAALLAVAVLVVPPFGRAERNRDDSSSRRIWQNLIAVLCNRQSMLCAIAGFGLASSMLSFSGLWAVPWLMGTQALSAVDAGAIVSWNFAGWMIGSPLLGWLSDRIGRRKPVLLTGVIIANVLLIVTLYAAIDNMVLMALLLFLLGVSCSSMVVLFGLVREWNQPAHAASAMALTNMGIVGSGAVMQPVIGMLLDSQWSGEVVNGARIYSTQNYGFAFSSLVAIMAISLACCVLVKESGGQQQRR